MNFMLKILEKLLLWNNEESILANSPLHNRQHGFRKGRSVDSALTCVVGKIEKSFMSPSQGFTIAVFLDIEGAYDNLQIVDLVY